MQTILGTGDVYIYPKYGLKQWDVCPGEVFMKARGGITRNCLNLPICYEKADAIPGFISTHNSHIFNVVLEKAGPFLYNLAKNKFPLK